MKQVLEFMHRFDRRQILLAVVAVLVLLNIGQWGWGFLVARQAELVDRMGMLAQYRKAVQRLPELEARVASLGRQQQQLESFLFHGEGEDQIASAMQILLQGEITGAGLEAEFIQPVRAGQSGDRHEQGDIVIKMRMSGSLNDFSRFLYARYSSKQLFRVENLSLKQFRPGELKISMDVRGYYKIGKEAGLSR